MTHDNDNANQPGSAVGRFAEAERVLDEVLSRRRAIRPYNAPSLGRHDRSRPEQESSVQLELHPSADNSKLLIGFPFSQFYDYFVAHFSATFELSEEEAAEIMKRRGTTRRALSDARRRVIQDHASAAFGAFRTQLSLKIVEASMAFVAECAAQALRELSPQQPDEWKALIDNADKEAGRLRRHRLGIRPGAVAEYDLSMLGFYWEQVAHVWKELKKRYQKDRNGPWRKICQAIVYDEMPVDPRVSIDDLFECLSDHPDLPAETLTVMEEKGWGSATAGDLALEHAARCCGAPPFHYSLQTLRNTKSRQAGKARSLPRLSKE